MNRWGKYLFGATALGAALWLRSKQARRAARQTSTTEQIGAEAATQRHARKVQRIAQQLRDRKSTAPLSRRKASVSHEVPKAVDPKYSDDKIDVQDLNEIIDIDVPNRVCTAEAGVTFVDLVEATLRHGLVPLLVPELKTITIGGLVAGCSIESMSFRHGGFHDTCLEYELVTAKGEVIVCSPSGDHALLFQMIHSSFGTLGIISRLRFKLTAAKPFVKVDYKTYETLAAYKNAIREHAQIDEVDFMDGIIHSPSKYVLSIGRFVDEAPYTNSYDWTKVYYQSTATRQEDYLRTADYFFRYDKGVTNVHPKSYLGRLIFGKFFGSTEFLYIAEKCPWLIPKERPTVTLDVFVPFSKFDSFMDWYKVEFDHFPLWCVPFRPARAYEWIDDAYYQQKVKDDDLFVDIAIYGMEQKDGRNMYKLMEDKLFELGGIKTLISYNFYTEEEFWKTWNRDNYAKVKAMTDPNNIFRDLYTKTCKKG